MRQHRSALAAAVAAAVLSTVGSPAPTGAAPVSSERASAATTYQRTAFRATNNRREQHHRKVLTRGDCVQKYAVRNARRMARREVMEHQNLGPIARDCHLGLVGENIAEGYPSGRAVVRGWMHSPPHRANLLKRRYRLLGLAARKGDNGRWYAAQVFGRKA